MIYIFIDESGDPGRLVSNQSNSKYYAELAMQVGDEGINALCEHITNWKYVKKICRELKNLPNGLDKIRFVEPIVRLQENGIIKCSCIYIDKLSYSGPYLNTPSPIKFRNFVHRKLLEFHFENYLPTSDKIELIFDRFEMSEEELQNLETYLRNNWNLPPVKYYTHADSSYCETLQLTSQLVNMVKDLKAANTDETFREKMRCLPIKDI